jgi:succinate-acetate transporter protein
MKLSDYIGFVLFGGFGVWWIVLPESVIKLYTWFHKGQVRLPDPSTIRVIGIVWVVVVAVVEFTTLCKK